MNSVPGWIETALCVCFFLFLKSNISADVLVCINMPARYIAHSCCNIFGMKFGLSEVITLQPQRGGRSPESLSEVTVFCLQLQDFSPPSHSLRLAMSAWGAVKVPLLILFWAFVQSSQFHLTDALGCARTSGGNSFHQDKNNKHYSAAFRGDAGCGMFLSPGTRLGIWSSSFRLTVSRTVTTWMSVWPRRKWSVMNQK